MSIGIGCLRFRHRGTIMLMALMSYLQACGGRVSPPVKPAGVPSEAVWAGGPDGGSFVFCEVDAINDVNHCRVWNDFNGQLVESGRYRLLQERRAANKSELTFAWADRGGWIGLKHGQILDNLDGHHPR